MHDVHVESNLSENKPSSRRLCESTGCALTRGAAIDRFDTHEKLDIIHGLKAAVM